MRITDIIGQRTSQSIAELEVALERRTEQGTNAFWLSPDGCEYPLLSILVRDDIAALDYLVTEIEPGFKSIGNLTADNQSGSTMFSISHNQADDLEISNDSLVSFSIAVEAAKEFFNSRKKPQCIEWFDCL